MYIIHRDSRFPASQRSVAASVRKCREATEAQTGRSGRRALEFAELTINRGFALSGSRFAPGAPASIKLARHPSSARLCEEGNALHPYVTVITKSSTQLPALLSRCPCLGVRINIR